MTPLIARRQVPTGNIFEALQAKLEDLSPSHQRVGRFLLTHFDEAVFLTAAQVARLAGTSESSVCRFARRLGYPGFPEFHEDLQVLLREKLLPAERMQRGGGIPKRSEAILDRTFERALANIRETRKLLDSRALHNAAKKITGAETKFVVGLRASAGTARLLGFYLGLIQPNVRVQTEGGPALFESLVSVSKKDVVVAASYPRYTKWTVDILRYAHDRGATTIAITDSLVSPIAQVANIALVARVDSITYGNSYVAPMLIVDTLIAMVLSLDRKKALTHLDALEKSLKGHDFFYAGSQIL